MVRKEEIPIKREMSVNKVIRELRKGAKRFKDLEEDTGLSPAGLNGALKMMKQNRMIEKNMIDKKQLYRLTGKGEKFNPSISYDITPIQLRSGSILEKERPSVVIQERDNSKEDSLKVNRSFEGTSLQNQNIENDHQ